MFRSAVPGHNSQDELPTVIVRSPFADLRHADSPDRSSPARPYVVRCSPGVDLLGYELSGADPRDVMMFERLFEKWDTFSARVANPVNGLSVGGRGTHRYCRYTRNAWKARNRSPGRRFFVF